jgi:hypothetical protein
MATLADGTLQKVRVKAYFTFCFHNPIYTGQCTSSTHGYIHYGRDVAPKAFAHLLRPSTPLFRRDALPTSLHYSHHFVLGVTRRQVRGSWLGKLGCKQSQCEPVQISIWSRKSRDFVYAAENRRLLEFAKRQRLRNRCFRPACGLVRRHMPPTHRHPVQTGTSKYT